MTTSRRRLILLSFIGLALLSGLLTVIVTGVWREALPAPDISGYPVKGIDVSSHNGEINFDKVVADSISFVYIKATEGVSFRDKRFHENYYAAKNAGLKVGAYHFYRFDCPADMQAVNLLQMIRGKEFDLPLVIDVEEWTNPDDISDRLVTDGVSRMIDYLKSRGYPVALYCNKNDHERFLSRRFPNIPLWICSFVEPSPDYSWTFLQYTHHGSVDGVRGSVDKNVYVGSDSVWQSAVNQWLFRAF